MNPEATIRQQMLARKAPASAFDSAMLSIYAGWAAIDAFLLRLFRAKQQPVSLRWQARFAIILLICQTGITFTGSLVRVTGSGLGCNTWPNCHPGSLFPVPGATPWVHQLIEFGNRLLTIVLVIAAAIAFTAVLRAARRTQILHLAFFQGIGIIVQAVIGGITVHLDLAWWIVMAHFLPSMLLVFFAAKLVVRIYEPDAGVRTALMPKPMRIATDLSAVALAITLITGTLTTAAGPHAGDEAILPEHRLQIPLFEMAQIHAHFMYLYLGITIGLLAGLFALRVGASVRKAGWFVVAAILANAAIGIVQYWLGVPRWTVPMHVIGSGLVTAAGGFLWAQKYRWVSK